MSFGFFLNFEKLAVKIIDEELSKMSDNNLMPPEECEPEGAMNEDAFLENLYHGAIAVTFIVNLYESALNTIISKRMNWMSEDVLKASHSLKLQMICFEYGIEYNQIKGSHHLRNVHDAIKLRNDITHYKTNEINEGSFVRADISIPMASNSKPLADLFTKSNLQNYYDSVLGFLELLCAKCGFVVNMDCQIIDCDARDDMYEFICDAQAYNEYT